MSKFQILVVDDSEADASLFTMALKEAAPRVRVYWVATMAEGSSYLRQEGRFADVGPVDLIVCDLNFGGETSFDFLQKTKREKATMSIPFVIYSGSSLPEDANRCYALGANSYIVKAMTHKAIVAQLTAMVHYWLETVRLPDPQILD